MDRMIGHRLNSSNYWRGFDGGKLMLKVIAHVLPRHLRRHLSSGAKKGRAKEFKPGKSSEPNYHVADIFTGLRMATAIDQTSKKALGY